jgi:hypothetical protein
MRSVVRVGQALHVFGVCLFACALAACGGARGSAHRASAGATRARAAGSVVDIKGSSPVWRDLLIKAVQTPNTTVRLAGSVDMDMTGLIDPIYFARGVNLTSEQPAAPVAKGTAKRAPGITPPVGPVTKLVPGRTPFSPGPRIYTTATRPSPLFELSCNGDTLDASNDRLFGFRLQGPHLDVADGSENEERGIEIDGCKGVEIADMEISGWSGEGIEVAAGAGALSSPSDIRIHDNYIHNNQHVGEDGYGVETAPGGWADIERNVFDLNRHAIASSGRVLTDAGGNVLAGTGYTANLNLILRGGGYNGSTFNTTTHILDVHGDDNCGIAGHPDSAWNCGNAGTEYWYTNNAVQYLADNSIHIRGKPRKAAYIYDNVFANPNLYDHFGGSGAIELATETNVHVGTGAQANTTGFDSYGRYGVCDLDRDRKDDLFLPTGASWWYASDARTNWWYLFDAHETLNNVALGDFDGDGRCDVFTVSGGQWFISKSGIGQWQSLGTYNIPFDQLAFGHFLNDGKTDIFRRAPNGQWSIVAPGSQDWHQGASSSFPLSELRFGDFTGDGITDVLAVEGGHWSISRSATGGWEPLNTKLSDSLGNVTIADLNGNGIDDFVRFKVTGFQGYPKPTAGTGRFEVSWDGRSSWQTLRDVTWSLPALPPYTSPVYFVGRFDSNPGADILYLDDSRTGRLLSSGTGTPIAWNAYPY